ncbi:MAG: hypothetical protein M9894_32430 [Planctomycetes bacterium]|nr:hypothetical protein [Planctomycetota bacterium]
MALAALLDLTGDPRGARAEVDEALRRAPEHVEALRLSAKLRLGVATPPAPSPSSTPPCAGAPDDVQLLGARAAARAMLRDDAGAVDDLLRVDRLAGGLSFGEHVMVAKSLHRLRRWRDADAAYAAALSLAPADDRELREELRREGGQARARVLAHDALEAHARGDLRRAIELLSGAIEADPAFANAPFNRGQMHLEAGDARAALADFDRALRLEDDAAGRLARAEALLLLGEGARALADLDQALARGAAAADTLPLRAERAGSWRRRRRLADAAAACAAAPRAPGPLALRARLRLALDDAAGARRTRAPPWRTRATTRARASSAPRRGARAR